MTTKLTLDAAARLLRDEITAAFDGPVTGAQWGGDARAVEAEIRGLFDGLYGRFLENQEQRLRLSFGSVCARRLWFSHHAPEAAITADGHQRIKYLHGDVWERVALAQLRARLETHPSGLRLAGRAQSIVEVDGILGHQDEELTLNGVPYALIDCKETSQWAWDKWEDRRKPDALWGYRHQAALYLEGRRRQGVELDGILWLCRVITERTSREARFEVGWMTAAELDPYVKDALERFALARGPALPQRPVASPEQVPCGTKHKAYCPFRDHCWSQQ